MNTPTPAMTDGHVEALLALLVSLDPRMRAPDEATAKIRVRAWSTLLAEVDPAYAVRYAEHAYQEVRDWPLQPAEILQAWRSEQVETAEHQGDELFGDDGVRRWSSSLGWEPAMIDYLRDVLAAAERGEDVLSVPRPQTTVKPLTAAQDAWQRRCAYHRICACDHTECRDGILDAEETIIGWNGHSYLTNRRCPHCNDALLMAIERGIAKRPSQHARRRTTAS